MGKTVPIEDRAVYRVAAYLTKKDHAALEKIAVKNKASISSLVALIIKESISNQTRT